MKGILDRFEDNNKAVILLEETNEELIISIDDLPQGSEENTWFNLEKKNDDYRVISINKDKSNKEATKTSDLMAQLRARSKRKN